MNTWPCYPQCVSKISPPKSKEPRSKPWLQSKCIKKISPPTWNAETWTISSGRNKPDWLGSKTKTTVWSTLQIGTAHTHMSSWEPKKDCASLHLPIDAISPSLKLWVCTTEEPRPDQQEPEKPKPWKIWEEHWECSSSLPTVQINIDIRIWPRSSKDWYNQVSGDASMSLIESISKYCPSWLCRSKPSPPPERPTQLNSSSQKKRTKSSWSQPSDTLLPWIQVMPEDRSCQKTWKCCSDPYLWWCQIEKSLLRWSWPRWDTTPSTLFPRNSTSCTNSAKSSCQNNVTTISVSEISCPCSEPPVTPRERSWNLTKKCCWWDLSEIWISPNWWPMISHFSMDCWKISSQNKPRSPRWTTQTSRRTSHKSWKRNTSSINLPSC